MRIIRRPRHYTLLCLFALLSVPVFVLNIWVMQKGVIAGVIRQDKIIWMACQAAAALLTLRWLLQARWLGFWALAAMASSMLGLNVYFLLTAKNYALAFYALFILILGVLYLAHLYEAIDEPYYHSGQEWFEGNPRFLPRIEAEVKVPSADSVPVRLSRLGARGCYAFPAGGGSLERAEGIALKLGELRLDCGVELVSRSMRGGGLGLRFLALSADERKDISDFIDRVRSAGYVA
jgi:hypothetical protein